LTTTALQPRTDLPPFLKVEEAGQYEQPEGTPYLLKRGGANLAGYLGDPSAATEWGEKQQTLMRWTQDPVMFNASDVAQNFGLYREFFENGPPRLRGRVLDVGGGWGLFRQWWQPGPDGCFVVHDPGVERFTTAPPETLKRFFGNGLSKPALFVEGFGEHLPYGDGTYDMVMIASALDHCADPPRVLAESFRVLRSGGRLLVIQGFEPEAGERRPGSSFLSRLWRVLTDWNRLHRAVRMRLFHRGEPHMHHFGRAELHEMLAAARFSRISETVISMRFGVLAIEAFRP